MKNGFNEKMKNERVGSRWTNNQGCVCTVMSYNSAKNISIKFDDSDIHQVTNWTDLVNGNVKNQMYASVCNVGYLGRVGVTDLLKNDNGCKKAHKYWSGMFNRCYNPYNLNVKTAYIDCTVDKAWHNFSNFYEWWCENYYEIDGERMELDKDILVRDNRVYGPDTCVYVPLTINNAFVLKKSERGALPIGVSKVNQKYRARLSIDGKRVESKSLPTPEDAFAFYKEAKEKYLRSLANRYDGRVPDNVTHVLRSYKVEITD